MAKTHLDVTLPVLPNDAYMLVRNSGAEIPSFRLQWEDPQQYRVKFYRGFGWSNPVDVDAAMWQSGPQQTTIRYEASILALADPFGFMKNNLERFQSHLHAHHDAWINQRPAPPPPKDSHSIKVNLGIIGCVFGGIFMMVLFLIIVAAAN